MVYMSSVIVIERYNMTQEQTNNKTEERKNRFSGRVLHANKGRVYQA